jgi:hypothetical protein
VFLKPSGQAPVDTADLALTVGGTAVSGWTTNGLLRQATIPVGGSPIRGWVIDAGANGLSKNTLEDILLLARYHL